MNTTEFATLEELEALRKNAEKLLDEAQQALFDDNVDDEDCLAKLDQALACLNSMISTSN